MLFVQITGWYGGGGSNTVEENSNPNALVAVSKGMWAVKLLQQNPAVLNSWCRLTGLSCIMAVKGLWLCRYYS